MLRRYHDAKTISQYNDITNHLKANLESLPVDQKTSAPKGGMLSKKIVGMKPRSPSSTLPSSVLTRLGHVDNFSISKHCDTNILKRLSVRLGADLVRDTSLGRLMS